MSTFGQLLYVSERRRGGIKYRIAVFRVAGGLQGKWSCDACDLDATQERTYPVLDDCVDAVKAAIDAHHAKQHTRS